MRSINKCIISFLVIGFLISGCAQNGSGTGEKPGSPKIEASPAPTPSPAPEPEPEEGGAVTEAGVTFQDVNRRIFIPKCIECHGASGGVNLESYERVQSELPIIEQVVLVEKSMPPDGESLTEEELQLIRDWFARGAP